MNQELEKKFPHLNDSERELMLTLSTSRNRDPETFEKSKKLLMDTVKNWALDYLKWDVAPDRRASLRRKLLNVAGIWSIIPFADIHRLLREIDPYNKKPITDQNIGNIYQEDAEIPTHDLKLVDSIATLLSSIPLDEETETNYLDFVSGNRAKKQHPASSVVVFKKTLADEVVGDGYLTASAEVFSKTILITTFDEKGDKRDLISIAFDLILESAYLDIYHNWSDEFIPELVLRNTKLIGCDFLEKVIGKLEEQKKNGRRLIDCYEIFPRDLAFIGFESWETIYLDLLKNRILKKNLTEIEALSRKLGM